MRFKRLLALLVSAALALSLLAGCGGGKALSQVIVDLLDNLYSNVSVEADSDLTAALKQAAAEGGTEEEILSRMIEILNHKGGSITFTRLGSGQQGNHAVTLYFQTGTDPDAAARNALAKWAGTLGTLPDDGSYQADVAMIETENGYYIALDVEVLKAGKPDKGDDDNQDDVLIRGDGMTYNPQSKSAIISGENGLASLVDTLEDVATEQGEALTIVLGETNITLNTNVSLPDNWPAHVNYKAQFDGQDHIISGLNMTDDDPQIGMFGQLEGTVKNVKFDSVTIDGENNVGTIVGENRGTIDNCHILSGTVSGSITVGGITGTNTGTISNSSVNCTVTGSRWVGGITANNGSNGLTGTIRNCTFSGSLTGNGNIVGGIAAQNVGTVSDCTNNASITNQGTGFDFKQCGGIVGNNQSSISNCTNNGSVQAAGPAVGGIAGQNTGTVSGCNNTASVTVTGSYYGRGGIVGANQNSILNCTNSGSVTSEGWSIGGIAGNNGPGASISGCTSYGNVQGTGKDGYNVGGIAGMNGGTITNSSFQNSTVEGSYCIGGVAGANGNIVKSCYAIGTVRGTGAPTSSGSGYVGGVVGQSTIASIVTACYAGGTVESAYPKAGGVVGQNDQGTVTACYSIVSSINGSTSVGGVVGENKGSVAACYWSNYDGSGIGSGTQNGVIKVDGTTTNWTKATDAMNAVCGDQYKDTGTGAPKLYWEN